MQNILGDAFVDSSEVAVAVIITFSTSSDITAFRVGAEGVSSESSASFYSTSNNCLTKHKNCSALEPN